MNEKIAAICFLLGALFLLAALVSAADNTGVWRIDAKKIGCHPIVASSPEVFSMAYQANIAGNDRMILDLINKNALQLLDHDGKYIIVQDIKPISFGHVVRLHTSKGEGEFWMDLGCLTRSK